MGRIYVIFAGWGIILTGIVLIICHLFFIGVYCAMIGTIVSTCTAMLDT